MPSLNDYDAMWSHPSDEEIDNEPFTDAPDDYDDYEEEDSDIDPDYEDEE